MSENVSYQYRVKLTPHLARLVKQSPAVAKQFLPDPREKEPFGTETPFEEGRLNQGIYGLERVYEDRAVLTPYFDCAAYCRYCFKKTRTLGATGSQRMSEADIEAAARFIEADPRIKTVLVTGGDPFEDLPLLRRVMERVHPIPHVTNFRIGTRNAVFRPDALTREVGEWLGSLNRIDYSNLRASKHVAVGLSLNHPDELSPEVARAIENLTRAGVSARGQIVLLKGINDEARTILDLLRLFSAVGVVPYYFLHCMPVVGTKHMRTSVQKGLDILSDLSHYTGAIAPLYVYVTEVGKHRLMPGVRLDYVDRAGQRYIRARTPYRADAFLHFTGKARLPPLHDADEDGYIVSHYLDGDDGA
jgi:lysine 2,3-aminomutase